MITDEYLEAMGMSLVRGRTLQPADVAPGAAPVALINERLATLVWPGEDPIGQRVSTWTAPDTPEWREVIGVVGDVRSFGPGNPVVPELFLPYTQPPPTAWDTPFQRSMALVVRTDGDAAPLAASLRRAVSSVDPSVPLFAVRTMEEALGMQMRSARFTTSLLALLAGAGILLAAVGIYGVIAYFVTQRTAEIGLRLALGASSRSVLLLVVRHGAALTGAGIVIGLAVAFAVTRLLTTQLF